MLREFRKTVKGLVATRVSVLDVFQLGSSLSVRSFARFGSSLYVVGYIRLGSAISLRSFARMGSSLAVLDILHVGAALYLRCFGRVGSRCPYLVQLSWDRV